MLQVIFALFYMYIRLDIVTFSNFCHLSPASSNKQLSQTHNLLCYGPDSNCSFDILDPVILSIVLLPPLVMVAFHLAVPLPVT